MLFDDRLAHAKIECPKDDPELQVVRAFQPKPQDLAEALRVAIRVRWRPLPDPRRFGVTQGAIG
jgi:hypothetical protein